MVFCGRWIFIDVRLWILLDVGLWSGTSPAQNYRLQTIDPQLSTIDRGLLTINYFPQVCLITLYASAKPSSPDLLKSKQASFLLTSVYLITPLKK